MTMNIQMRSFRATYTPQIKRLLDWKQGIKQRRLYMPFSMAQELPKSGRLLVVQQKKDSDLLILFYATHRSSQNYGKKLVTSTLKKGNYRVLTDGSYSFGR